MSKLNETCAFILNQDKVQVLPVLLEDAMDTDIEQTSKLRGALPIDNDFDSFWKIVSSLETPRVFMVTHDLADSVKIQLPLLNYEEQADKFKDDFAEITEELKREFSAELIDQAKINSKKIICSIHLYALIDGVFVIWTAVDEAAINFIRRVTALLNTLDDTNFKAKVKNRYSL